MRYLTKPTQQAFLKCLAIHGNVARAVAATNQVMVSGDRRGSLTRQTIYVWLKDPSFHDQMQEALATFADGLESIAYDRITNPVGNKGSDVLLMFLLNGLKPSTYRQNVTNSNDSTRELLSAVRLKLSTTTSKAGTTDIDITLASKAGE